MDLRYTTFDLRKLDLFVSELIILPQFSDERPPRGATGLTDYRLLGEISQLLLTGRFTGAVGESYVLRPRPRLPFDQLLLVGAGRKDEFNPQVFAFIIEQMLQFTQAGEIRRAVVELPGRSSDLIEPEIAVAILRQQSEAYSHADTWTLIDTPDVTKRLAKIRRDRASDWGVQR